MAAGRACRTLRSVSKRRRRRCHAKLSGGAGRNIVMTSAGGNIGSAADISTANAETPAFYRLCGIGAAIVILTLSTPIAFKTWGDNAYIALTITAGLLTLLSTRIAERAPVVRTLWLIVGLALVLRL